MEPLFEGSNRFPSFTLPPGIADRPVGLPVSLHHGLSVCPLMDLVVVVFGLLAQTVAVSLAGSSSFRCESWSAHVTARRPPGAAGADRVVPKRTPCHLEVVSSCSPKGLGVAVQSPGRQERTHPTLPHREAKLSEVG